MSIARKTSDIPNYIELSENILYIFRNTKRDLNKYYATLFSIFFRKNIKEVNSYY